MDDSVSVKGELLIQVVRDGKVIDERKVTNLITTAGLALVAQLVTGLGTAFSHMAIGTSTTAAAIGDTALGLEAGRVTLTSKDATSGTVAYIGDFPAGTGTGTIVEAGVFNASSGGTMLNRTVFSPVTKTASDALKITWNVTFG